MVRRASEGIRLLVQTKDQPGRDRQPLGGLPKILHTPTTPRLIVCFSRPIPNRDEMVGFLFCVGRWEDTTRQHKEQASEASSESEWK